MRRKLQNRSWLINGAAATPNMKKTIAIKIINFQPRAQPDSWSTLDTTAGCSFSFFDCSFLLSSVLELSCLRLRRPFCKPLVEASATLETEQDKLLTWALSSLICCSKLCFTCKTNMNNKLFLKIFLENGDKIMRKIQS